MSQEAFKLIGVVEARTRDAENDLRRVDRVAQTTARSMNSSLGSTEKGFLSAGRGANSFLERFSHISQIIQGIPQIGQLAGALTRPLFQAAEEGIRLNMTLEQAAIGYEQVAGSAKKAQQFLDNLQRFGQQSPFRFEGLLQASRLMTAMGFTLDEQIPKLKIWGNAIASSGELSAEKIHDVVNAFGQMRMAGRVNGQDMMQLTNANIPGWQLLAKAIGKTVEETRDLSEAGRLNGAAAVEAITAMMAQDSRFKGMMDRLQNTTAGRLSAAEDTVQIAQAKATKGLTGNISETIGAALKKEDLVNGLASKIDSVLTPISGALTASITSMLEGNADGLKTAAKDVLGSALSSGLSEGLVQGATDVKDAIGSLVSEGVVKPFKSLLGIKSPSQVFNGFGHRAAEGFTEGFAEGLFDGSFDSIIEKFLGHVEGKLSATKKRSAENLANLMQREPGFKDKLIRGSQQRGINPDDLLNVMAVETAGTFNPAAKNPNSSASGLIQFMAATAQAIGTTTEALRKMSATQQLDYVFKYFDKFFKDRDLSTQGALYAAVGAGRVGSNDNSVVMTSRSRGYAGNAPTWDPNGDGIVRQGEMAAAAQNKLGAGINFSINGSPVSVSNPVPVTISAEMMTAIAQALNVGIMAIAKGQKQPQAQQRSARNVGIDISANLPGPSATNKTIDSIVAKMRAGNQELTTSTTTLATTIVPKATQAFAQMADSTEQAFKAAGQYAKDVITESKEAVRRMKFEWNAVAAGFESAFQNSFRELFTEGGKKAGLDFLQSFVGSIGDEASRQLSSIISRHLFNFDGGSSESNGGLVGNVVRGLFGKLGIGKKSSSSGSTVDVQGALNNAMQHAVELNRGATRPRRVSDQGTLAQTQNVGVDTSINNGITSQVVKDSTDKITSGQQAQTAAINTQISASADRIVDGLTPRQESFWKGLLTTTLSAAAGGAAGAATGGLLGGGGSSTGSSTPRGTVTSTATETDAPVETRPRRVGGHRFGGIINGPGTDTSDSILGLDRQGVPTTMVSRGEFVVNAAATRKQRAVLEMINRTGELPRLGWGGFLKWTSPISNKSVRNATMPITNEGFRNFTMPLATPEGRHLLSPALLPNNDRGGNTIVHNNHFHIHSNDAQGIQKSRTQIERQLASSMRRVTSQMAA
jgi:tape measure domain-containing protein